MLAPRLALRSRSLFAAATGRSLVRSQSWRPYVTSPLTPDPDAKPAAADLPVKPAADNRPFGPPATEDETRGELGQVKMPDMKESDEGEVESQQVRIPTAPDTYRTTESSPDSQTEPAMHAPKVSTVTHPSTYPGGGPSLNKAGQEGDVLLDNVSPSESHTSANHAAKESHSSKSESHSAKSSKSDSHDDKKQSDKYEWEDRKLDAEEMRGLYILGGMLAGGFVLSTLTQPGYMRRRNN